MLILLYVCLVGQPATCREDRIALSFDEASDTACLSQAQPLIAQWQETHANWHVERWRCARRESLDKDI